MTRKHIDHLIRFNFTESLTVIPTECDFCGLDIDIGDTCYINIIDVVSGDRILICETCFDGS